MEVNNPLYKNQGIHVVSSIFTVDRGVCKVLLIQRKNEPFKGKWALVGGALYNNETLEDGMMRELKEKTNISSIRLIPAKNYSDVKRSPVMRMIAVSYIGVIDIKSANLITKTLKTENAIWFSIDDTPELAYDHNEILKDAITLLKAKIVSSDILTFPLNKLEISVYFLLNVEITSISDCSLVIPLDNIFKVIIIFDLLS